MQLSTLRGKRSFMYIYIPTRSWKLKKKKPFVKEACGWSQNKPHYIYIGWFSHGLEIRNSYLRTKRTTFFFFLAQNEQLWCWGDKQLVFTFFFHFFRDGIGVLFTMKKTFAANSNTFTLSHTLFGTLRDINPYQFNLLAWLEIDPLDHFWMINLPLNY